MKKLTPQQKREAGMALNLTELAQVSGWGISSLRAMRLPLVYGKIRESDFWRIVRAYQETMVQMWPPPGVLTPVSPSTPAAAGDLRSVADKFRAPRNSNGRKAASPNRAVSQLHNNE